MMTSFFLSNDRFPLKIFDEIGIPGRANSFWIWSCRYMKIMYVNCGVKEDHCSYIHKFCSCEKKAWKTKKPESFSGFLFPTAKVAYITAMIFLHVVLNLLPAVENQNWHWPGPARCDRLIIVNKLFRDPTPYIRKSPSL